MRNFKVEKIKLTEQTCKAGMIVTYIDGYEYITGNRYADLVELHFADGDFFRTVRIDNIFISRATPLNMEALDKIQSDIELWSNQTFGNEPIRIIGLANHLVEEAKEVKRYCEDIVAIDTAERSEISEVDIEQRCRLAESLKFDIADCLILISDILAKNNLTFRDAFTAVTTKMKTNKFRKWSPPDENGVCHHIK